MRLIECQACGTVNPDGTEYCTKCARKLDAATQQRVVQQRVAHTATGIRWSAVLLAIVIVVVVAVVIALFATHIL